MIRIFQILNTARPSSPITYSRDDFIDILRGLAIFLVLIFHALGTSFGYDHLRWGSGLFPNFDVARSFLLLLPATFGWAGVAIFFAISGFCIHNSYTRDRNLDATRRYLIKRVFRIYPPYIASLFLFSFLWPSRHGALFSFLWPDSHNDFGDVTAHILLLHNFSSIYLFGINPAYWSIAVEFQLYLLYIPLIKSIKKFGWLPIVTLAFLLEICIRSTEAYYLVRYGAVPKFLLGCPLGFIFSWSIGALIAECCKTKYTVYNIKRWYIIATILAAVLCTFFKPLSTFSFMLFSIVSAMAIMYAHKNEIQIRWWRMGSLLSLGIVSYSFYLIHQPIILLVPRIYHYFNISPDPLVVFATCVFMVIPLFWCSRFTRSLVEMPSINMGYRYLAMRKEPFVRSTITAPADLSLLEQPIPTRAVAYSAESDTKAGHL